MNPEPPARPGPDLRAPQQLPSLKVKLVWLTLFRLVATTLLLVTSLVRLLSGPLSEPSRADTLLFAVIVCVYLLTLVYGVTLRLGWAGTRAAYVQVLGDVAISSAIVHFTGGVESPFAFTYSLAVVAGSILVGQRGAMVAALASAGSFGALSLSTHFGLLQNPEAISVPLDRLVVVVLSNALAQFLVAALASYMSRQVSAAGGQLSAREADLKEIVGLQNQIVSSMPSGLITCDADGLITFINPAGRSFLGIEPGQPRPRHIEEVIPNVLAVKPGTRRGEIAVETRGGRRILGLAVTRLEGRTGSLLVVFQDLTDLRRVEDELKRSDHLASLGKLAAQLAHEIRNPLASMRGSAQMLAADAPQDAASAKLAHILIRESDRLSGLVEDFLRFARPPPPNLRRQSLSQLTHDTVTMMKADPLARDVQLEERLSDVEAHCDAGQIRQVLLNLLRNAFAAVGPGGKVVVTVDAHEGTPRVRVWDSAGSIPSGDLARIFDPFYTTRVSGTGLGLSTAHSIVSAHGGKIQVSSSPEQGTEFRVLLPAVDVGEPA